MSRRDPYLYEDAPVLKNLPGIKNSEELKRVEGDLTRMSMGIVYAREYDKYNTETLCDIHRTIFGGLYEWAGEFRTIPALEIQGMRGVSTARAAASAAARSAASGCFSASFRRRSRSGVRGCLLLRRTAGASLP